ncbi:MAG TPA: BlaI/MecI/CopY family transcriptional regulator [Dinghuibacter sp.]|jgi:predicted transcriptional regulator|uniref:BlaI/MecI/CopY family transcriptional regulator n=1 Tax=Dinghuibacter sp. TaxID=2024697 RepID=UPI002B8D29C1|nr:BlaI/MecI/CopY family transcriptional regulator [Dinghuibacter sp.]HTJ12249.1 BlaI/MecI/CopY family transcriptional regulator [Dinghuibacter sp.]
MPPKTLTKAEEQIMQVLWSVGKGFSRDILEALPQPKPHQNTVGTILKILQDKGFVGANLVGRNHEYYPVVSKEEYSKSSLKSFAKSYFDGSFSNMVSFFVKEKSLSVEELEKLLQQIKKQKK